ncbi:ABC transporter permease subunit [Bremerella sp. JC817]|uniref:ABC transporter permease n=1 Tax=Bremerella sp. JC817 TaxID=3231756 RepID=UPI00345A6447
MKYKIIRILDVAGLRVFEPVVLLCYGEEPREQLKKIGLYIAIPVLVMVACVVAWDLIGPRIKTRAGEVPTPAQVVTAYDGIADFHKREYTKVADYNIEGEKREAALTKTKEEIAALDTDWEAIGAKCEDLLKSLLAKVPAEAEAKKAEIEEGWNKLVADLKSDEASATDAARRKFAYVEGISAQFVSASLTKLSDAVTKQDQVYKSDQQARAKELTAMAAKIPADDYKQKVEYVHQVNEHLVQTGKENDHMKSLRSELSERRGKSLPQVEDLRQQISKTGQKSEFLATRVNLLTDGNRQQKIDKAQSEMEDLKRKYAVASGPEMFALAQQLIQREERINTIASSEFAKPPTFFDQIWTSLKCVFTGFFIATAIAIPIGVLCGMSRVFMASMTPLISLFKPVSPIVWLPIVFFIVGAFITKPDEAWIQPSFLSSAITVALCSLWPTLVNTALGVSAIDQDHLNVARVLRLGLWDRLTKIIIPSALPLIFTGLRISLGVGWMVLIAAELLSSSPGIGKFVWDMFNNGSSATFAQMFVACGFVGVIGLLLDRIMIVFQRMVSFDGAPTGL